MFTIKSTSDEGEYYLVNHWNKYHKFWQHKDQISLDNIFLDERSAKTSLTKLLKIMPDYSSDDFTMVRVYSLIGVNGTHKETKELYHIERR